MILPITWHVKEHIDDSNYNSVTAFFQSLFNAKASWNEGALEKVVVMIFVQREEEINYYYNNQ